MGGNENWHSGKTSCNLGTTRRCHFGCKWRSISSIITIPWPDKGLFKVGFAIDNRRAISPINAIMHFSPSDNCCTDSRRPCFSTSMRRVAPNSQIRKFGQKAAQRAANCLRLTIRKAEAIRFTLIVDVFAVLVLQRSSRSRNHSKKVRKLAPAVSASS